ncbi:MAG: lipopolysaccharide heptosyltransferase II [Candidatus Omnitrophica bacterium]|nr:lipopolysaccharide heptosyltransferase II [Candidatus Omnitrophota bacterium]
MNILQVVPELNIGGVERGTIDLSRQLVKRGHKVVVVSNGGLLVSELELSGAVHYQLPVHRKSPWCILQMIKPLCEIIEKEKIDIVHARSRAPAWSAYFACRKTRRPFVTTCHGYYSKHPFSSVMGWGKRVIVISNVIAKHMIEDFSVPYERIRLIPRSVDLERFCFTEPEQKLDNIFDVGIIGRLSPIKGHEYFLRAMAQLYIYNQNIKIWIVGDTAGSYDAYKQYLRTLVKRLGLERITEFLGNQKDIPAVLSQLDVLVMATITQEAFGRVIIEAQASGVPVVATRVGGVVDIIEDGKTGLLVPAKDIASMCEALKRLMEDKALAKKIAVNAYRKVKERYSLESMVDKTVAVYHEVLSSPQVLIIKMSSLGDIILATAAIRAVRQRFKPPAKISVLVSADYQEILARNPHIDELFVCDFKGRDKGLFGFLRLANKLRAKGFDIVIDLQNNRRSHLLAWLSGAFERYGYDNKKFSFLLNHRIKDKKDPCNPVQHQFRLLEQLGVKSDTLSLELFPQKEDQQYVDNFLNQQWLGSQKLVGINIGASKRWQTKLWPLSHLARLCRELAQRDIRVVVTGSDTDKKRVQQLLKITSSAKIIDACGKFSINQLACLIKRCSVYISGDSAPLHVAVSVGVPIIALFGPTDPLRHMPSVKDCIILNKKIACAPCYRSKCKKCVCMHSITPEEVISAIEDLLKINQPKKS